MKKPNIEISGVITALITPFRDGQLDEGSFIRLLHQQVKSKVDGFVVNGTTGESPTLAPHEVVRLIEIVRAETGLPLIVGVGSNSTQKAVEMAKSFSKFKPSAFLSVVPYYNRPPQRGLVKHFSTIAEASDIPLILYNVPSRTVARLEADTVGELARHSNIIGIKEATGDLKFLKEIQARVPRDFVLLSGDDATCVEFVREGGHGVVSVCSHVIGEELKESMLAKDPHFAEKYAEVLRLLYIEANPIPVKMAMHWMGVIHSPELRLPLVALDEKYHGEFKRCLQNLAKI